MAWIQHFYERQADWGGLYRGPPEPEHQQQAERIRQQVGPPPLRVLELGAGGGQSAACAAAAGYTVTAVECVPAAAENARQLARTLVPFDVVEGDFHTIALEGTYDVVCYWDGFGVGSDAEQRHLLQRMSRAWLARGGCALIDVYAPWFAAASAGREGSIAPGVKRQYDFDAEGCRWLDTWTRGETSVTQSLRCYSPADLTLLLEGTGLQVAAISPLGGRPLLAAVGYTARLVRTG